MKRSFKKLMPVFILIAIAAILWAVRAYNSYRLHVEKETRFMMDTYVTIYAIGPKKITSPVISFALDRMQEADVKFNVLNPKSPLYAFNHEGAPVTDKEIINVVKIALDIARKTDGALDITVSPLIDLWGFYTTEYHLPSKEDIKDCLQKVDYRYLYIKDGALRKSNPDVMIDLGAIAKGYSVGQAVKALKQNGVDSALIDAGGDIYALGKKGSGMWKVGIRDPRKEGILGFVEAEDLAIMGSGDYERFFIKDGKRYHHIFNPKTGYPAEGLSGLTIIYPDSTMADAWATAFFVMGPEKGLEAVERVQGMEIIMVTTKGETLYSSGLKDILQAVPKQVK